VSKQLLVSKRLSALVDDLDFEWAQHFTWHARNAYVYRLTRHRPAPAVRHYLHDEVAARMGLTLAPGERVNHKDWNPLNNQRANLEPLSNQHNVAHARKFQSRQGKVFSSLYRGVYWSATHQKWKAVLRHNYRNYSLGHHDTPEAAARAYDTAALALRGESARPSLNFPDAAQSSPTPAPGETASPTPNAPPRVSPRQNS
jgi:hypothetical protein